MQLHSDLDIGMQLGSENMINVSLICSPDSSQLVARHLRTLGPPQHCPLLFLLIVTGRPHSFRTLWTPGHRVTAVNLTERDNSAGWLIVISPLTMNQQLDVAAR